MEKIYTEDQHYCEIAKASPEAIRFILNFSQVLKITKHRQFSFESILN